MVNKFLVASLFSIMSLGAHSQNFDSTGTNRVFMADQPPMVETVVVPGYQTLVNGAVLPRTFSAYNHDHSPESFFCVVKTGAPGGVPPGLNPLNNTDSCPSNTVPILMTDIRVTAGS